MRNRSGWQGGMVGEGDDVGASISLDPEKGHVVETSQGPIRCRYLVDAAGYSSPLARKLNLAEKEERHQVGSYWARVRGHKILDQLGGAEWRKRVDYTQRYLSTNHFMYPGYWIWHIALGEDLMSIGVTFDKKTNVDSAVSGMSQFSTLFLTFGTFSIIAGITLIINIFVMLSEERKEEMGISRAVGMKRRHLRMLYLFEGTSYSVISSLVGVILKIDLCCGSTLSASTLILSSEAV